MKQYRMHIVVAGVFLLAIALSYYRAVSFTDSNKEVTTVKVNATVEFPK